MSHMKPMKPQHKTNNETKYPMANRVSKNLERNKKEGSKFILSSRRGPPLEAGKTSNDYQQCKGSGSYCRGSKRDKKTKPQNNYELIRKQEEYLLQVYAKLQVAPKNIGKRKTIFVDNEINTEYEKLQRKYCPWFSLHKKSNKNNQSDKSFHRFEHKFPKRSQKKPVMNSQANSEQRKQNKSKSNLNKQVKAKDSHKDSHSSDRMSGPQKQCDKNPSLQHTNNDNCLQSGSALSACKQDIAYPNIQQVLSHQLIPNIQTIFYCEDNLKKKIKKAIILGKSADITNTFLADTIEQALKEKFSRTTIKSVLNNIKHFNSKQKVLHLVQIQLGQNVFILCTVRSCNFCNLLFTLNTIMKPLRAKFAPVLQHFTHCCVIEATVPEAYLQLNTKELRRQLDWQAEVLKLKQIALVDESSGEVSVQCLPVSMPNVSQSLESYGYKILSTDYEFQANKEIVLDTSTGVKYRQLINKLLEVEDIETISDNVIY